MNVLIQDLRFALRMLIKNPGFGAVVVLTLALGLGANTAIFSIVNAVLLRPLPFPDSGQLVRIVDNQAGLGLRDVGISVPELQDLALRSGVFDQVAGTWPIDANITGASEPQRVEFVGVSPTYFSLLGAKPQLGHTFEPEDQVAGFAQHVVISDGLWHRLFGGDPNVIGKKVRLDNDVYVIAGVMGPDFHHPGKTKGSGDIELWAAAGWTADPFPAKPQRSNRMLPGAIGRIRPGMTLLQAQAKLNAFTKGLEREYPNDYKPGTRWSVELESLQETVVGNVRPLLLVLLGAVALMLLTGCVNIANLLLARASARQKEIAIRKALGAPRGRLLQQLLTESIFLSLVAGAVGVAVAFVGMNLFLKFVPSRIPRLDEVGLNLPVMLFSLGLSVVTGVFFGLAPALQVSSDATAESLKDSSRGSQGSIRQNRVSNLLMVSEFAICIVLMIGAGLLVRSFWKLINSNPGFDPQNRLVARIWLPVPNDPKANPYLNPNDRTNFVREVLRRVRELPGVEMAAIASGLPLSGDAQPIAITLEGHDNPSLGATTAEFVQASPDYFKALAAPLIEGRFFQESDQRGAPIVAIIDQSTARRYWPGQSPIGKRVKFGPPSAPAPWATIAGVVGDIHNDGIDKDDVPHIYYSIYQFTGNAFGVIVRSPSDPTRLGESVRHAIQSVDHELPVFGIRTLSDIVNTSLAQHRFSAQLMGAFAILALALAAIGIYGVLAYSIGRRTREIGIRIALGARRGEVIRMVLWQGMRLILYGIGVGVVLALGLSRLLSSLVYGVSATDPAVFFVVPCVLAAVAVLASYLPALRATRIDPMIALRAE